MLSFFSTNITKNYSLIKKVLSAKFVSEGKITEKFENKLKFFLKTKFCVTVNSGTAAIHLALIASGVKKDDEVILPTQTFIATGLPILYLGAKPIFADIDINTGNISPLSIKKLITKKTKAIIVVHWGGYPCELSEIKFIAKKYNLKLIEDAAHCFGGVYKNKKIGSISDFTCFSFQAIKHLTSGDGGLICCKNKKDELLLKKIRWFGFDRKLKKNALGLRQDKVNLIGYKYHLNNYAAALGLSNMKNLRKLIKHHVTIGDYYSKKLKNIPGLQLLSFKKDRLHTYWFYQILVKDRNKFIKVLKKINFPCSVIDKRIDDYPIFKQFKRKLIVTEKFERTKLALPVHMGITKKIIDKMAKHIKLNFSN
jgi:perosamine synthetase